MTRERHHSAGIVLFRGASSREYLLLRSALTRRPVWEFPKGGVERGETEVEAAERELREETGLVEGDYALLSGYRDEEHYFFTRADGAGRRLIQKRVTYFLAEWQHGEVELSPEASRYVWVSYTEARRLLRFPEKRRILASSEQWLRDRESDLDPVHPGGASGAVPA